MTGILMGVCAALTVMVVVLAFLGWSINREVGDQWEEIEKLQGQISSLNRCLTSAENKHDKKCDRIEIIYTPDDSGAPRYGGF